MNNEENVLPQSNSSFLFIARKQTFSLGGKSRLVQLATNFGIAERNGVPIVSSRMVADNFDRRHDHILRTVDTLTDPKSGVSEKFVLQNFMNSRYKDGSGKWNREVLMTKDGFVMTVMEIKNAKARRVKEAYIGRFNEMEEFIRGLQSAKLEFPEFTEAIMLAHTEPRHYHFSNELNMINKIVLGKTAKQFKEENGIGDVPSIRPFLDTQQIHGIERLQKFDTGLIYTEPDFQKRKLILTDYHQKVNSVRLIKAAM